ncbi:MAG: glycosyltransferase, partial [Geminicoccaceae bacterium]|nr:glycosyltransferase [Geminicoccaceae bacterium]
AMLEAAAAGLPVVAGRDGGVAEVVQDGRTGLLVPADDPAAFAGAIAALLDDPVRRLRMGDAAARFVATKRSLAQAGRILDGALRTAGAIHRRRAGGRTLRG